MSLLEHLIYFALWLSFGLGHSLLAWPAVRRWVAGRVGPAERLTYNAVATLHIALVLGLGLWLADGAGAPLVPAWLQGLQWGLAAVGVAVLYAGLREYELDRFLGTWQLRRRAGPDSDTVGEALVTRGLHRYVRHPLYSGGLALLWGLAQSDFGVATAVWGTLYFVVGTWFEERKLIRSFGQAYRDYRRRVPAFVPWKGRAI
jgi:protein-S-isoprenylcysteine O-methyltransferase Ste14